MGPYRHVHIWLIVVVTFVWGVFIERAPLWHFRRYEFGQRRGDVVDRLTTIEHVFHVTNNKNHDLRLLGVEKSCGCLEASIDRQLLSRTKKPP